MSTLEGFGYGLAAGGWLVIMAIPKQHIAPPVGWVALGLLAVGFIIACPYWGNRAAKAGK